MRRALIGYTGFVGSNLYGQIHFTHRYRSTDVHEMKGLCFDEIYCAALPAAKWKANSDPEQDLLNMNQLCDVLKTVQCRSRFILISTIDVYPSPMLVSGIADEDSNLTNASNHPYGMHRLEFETFVLSTFPKVSSVVRLPALFGRELKKNAIFDLLHNHHIGAINANSSFQFYFLDHLAEDIEKANTMRIVNLFPPPVGIRDIVETFFSERYVVHASTGKIEPIFENGEDALALNKEQHYMVRTISHPSGYWGTKDDVFRDIGYFIKSTSKREAIAESVARRLCVSNIAWSPEESEQAYALLKSHGIRRIEVAPSLLVQNWNCLDEFDAAGFAESLKLKYDLSVDSLQAVTFGLSDLKLFGSVGSRQKLFAHLCKCIRFCSSLGGKYIVFGSPKNRLVPMSMSVDQSLDIAIPFFRDVGNIAYAHKVIFCIEPNARAYGCNFCVDSLETTRLVRLVNHPSIRVHLDTGCAKMENEGATGGRDKRRRMARPSTYFATKPTTLRHRDRRRTLLLET